MDQEMGRDGDWEGWDVEREVHERGEYYGKLIYEEESYAIRGAVYEVYRVMGCGFFEAVYQECLGREFGLRRIPYKAQVELRLSYKEEPLLQTFRPDFVCYDNIIVEIKALREIDNEHRAQVFNYLRASGYRLGLLVNFGHYPRVTIERIAL
jgi:GxxExxY protein